MTRLVRVTLCQLLTRAVRDFGEYKSHVLSLLNQCADADLVIFPEYATLELFTVSPDWQSRTFSNLGEELDQFTDDYRELFRTEAKARGQFILAGTHIMRLNEGIYNVAHLFEPNGTLHLHAKTHIFPGEREWRSCEGNKMDVITLPLATVGLNVCYELEIPECTKTLVDKGVQIVLSPSATFSEAGFWRVRHCAQARAIENQIYVAHCSIGGNLGAPMPNAWARSSVVGPCDFAWTNPAGVIAEADANVEQVIAASLDLDRLAENRISGSATTFKDRRRRADVYAEWEANSRKAEKPQSLVA
jgi:predicted amidohydrolase